MIFQGQELLEDQWFRDDHPIDWARLDSESGVVRMYRDLIALRRNLDGRSAGLTGQHVRVHHVNQVDKVVAFYRWDAAGPGDDVIVIANFAERRHEAYSIGAPVGGTWEVVFDGDAPVYHESYEGSGATEAEATSTPLDGMPASLTVGLAPYSALILVNPGQSE